MKKDSNADAHHGTSLMKGDFPPLLRSGQQYQSWLRFNFGPRRRLDVQRLLGQASHKKTLLHYAEFDRSFGLERSQ